MRVTLSPARCAAAARPSRAGAPRGGRVVARAGSPPDNGECPAGPAALGTGDVPPAPPHPRCPRAPPPGGAPEDLAYVAKLVAASVAGAAAIKYGSLVVPIGFTPNAPLALALVLGPPLAYALAKAAGDGAGGSGPE